MPHTPSHRWEDVADQYRTEWERTHPNTPWNDISYGYRYGWESAHDPRYGDRNWNDVERDLNSGWNDWQTRNRTSSAGQQIQQSWADLKDNVRHGWEKAKREFDKLT